MLQQLRPGTRRLSTGPMLVIHLSVMVQPVPRRPSLRPKLRMTVAVPSMMKLVIILSMMMMMMMQPGCLMTRNGKTWGSSWLERWRRAQMHSPEFIATLFFDLLFFVEGKLLESNLSQANAMMRQVTEVCNQIRAMVRFCAQHNLEEDEIMAPASSASDSWLFQLDASAAIIAARQKFLESQKETDLGALLCSVDWFPEHRIFLPNNKRLRRCVLSCAELEQHLRLKGLDAERKWSLGGWWPILAIKNIEDVQHCRKQRPALLQGGSVSQDGCRADGSGVLSNWHSKILLPACQHHGASGKKKGSRACHCRSTVWTKSVWFWEAFFST